jgi:hypothetical protein
LALPAVDELTEFTLQVVVEYDVHGQRQQVRNQWSLWVVPPVIVADASDSTADDRIQVEFDPSLAPKLREVFAQPPLQGRIVHPPSSAVSTPRKIVVASRFHLDLLEQLEAGATVLMFPAGGSHSFPTQAHWFLRGGPLLFNHPLWGTTDVEIERHQAATVDLQHFDLAGDVQPQFHYWNECSPVVGLWDNHDLKEVRVHGLLWEAKVGQGHLMVSYLDHDPQRSAYGPYLLDRILQYLSGAGTADSAKLPTTANGLGERRVSEPRSWSSALRDRLRSDLVGQDINLTDAPWRLQPDPQQAGFREQWSDPDHDTSRWQPIRIDAHWEGQGFAALDGWAWYATEVTVPEDWASPEAYLCMTGVDDHYQVFVNGQAVGQAGVIETKETAFEIRSSHRLPDTVKPGTRLTIRIAVYDWYGAGGIFRPIYLRSTPLSELPPLLKP